MDHLSSGCSTRVGHQSGSQQAGSVPSEFPAEEVLGGWAADEFGLGALTSAVSRTFAWRTPTPTNREIAYFIAFPRLRLLDDDVVEWCKFGKTVADLPQDQLEPRVEWVGQHADLPIEDVALDTEVAPKVIQAVLAAQ